MKIKKNTYYKEECFNGGYEIYRTSDTHVREVAMYHEGELTLFNDDAFMMTLRQFARHANPDDVKELTDQEAFLELI